MDNIKQYLKNLYQNFMVETREYVHPSYEAKCLGAMEAILVVLGVLIPGQPFQYKTTEKEFRLFWLFPMKRKIVESYREHILRLVYETLNKE